MTHSNDVRQEQRVERKFDEEEVAAVIVELREGEGMRYSDIAKVVPRNRTWVEEVYKEYGNDTRGRTWICPTCGEICRARSRPELCPVCTHDGYELVEKVVHDAH